MIPERTQPHEQSTMQLTEALLSQMRAETGAADQQPREDLHHVHNKSMLGPAAAAARSTGTSEESEIYQELERMEMELVKVRDENGRLRDEKDACEAAHSRDVAALEAMLDQMMSENKRLTRALSDTTQLCAKKANPTCSPSSLDHKIADYNKFEGVPLTPHSIHSVSEPALEPDTDRTIEL